MKRTDADIYLCPNCKGRLELSRGVGVRKDEIPEEILEGRLTCRTCPADFPVRGSIPRFVGSDHYAASFGYQWQKFARTQLGPAQKQIAKIRFDATTQWPQNLKGQLLLEVGSGAGRFTEIALETGAEVYSFDLSEAVESAQRNIAASSMKDRLHLFQGDLYRLPLPHGRFDKIMCLGVLQHCPDVKQAYLGLVPFLKPGGELVVDCYLSQPLRHAFNLKYLLRPFFKGWTPESLYQFWSRVISFAYDMKSAVTKIPFIGQALGRFIPIGKLNYEPEFHFSVEELKEIKTLSVIDMLSPKYDKCQTLSRFRSWMEEAGLEILALTTGYNGINARARRK